MVPVLSVLFQVKSINDYVINDCASSTFETVRHHGYYCTYTHAGITNSYTFIQISLWRTFHTLGLCWSIAFPFHYRRSKTEVRIKYIHAFTVVLGLVLPAIPALLPLIDGYSIVPGPLNLCLGRNIAITYFTTILPVSILVATSMSLLVFMFWKIFKVFLQRLLKSRLYHYNLIFILL